MVNFPKLKPISSLNKVLVAEEDQTSFVISHPKHLPFFASPLAVDRQRHDHQYSGASSLKSQVQHKEFTPRDSEYDQGSEDPDEPVLHSKDSQGHEKHESSTIQLFYDLFFVANLTTFTSVHEINDANTLKSYVGFFAILWFTWFQVALFDLRFGNDSVTERICKACQFGVMVGFAVVGPGYKTGWEAGSKEATAALTAFKTLSLILMASRLILASQYAAAFYYLKSYKKAWQPLLVHIGVLSVTSIVYLVLFFSFNLGGTGEVSIVCWYVTIGLEAAGILIVSGRAKFLSLRRTSIVERLGLLTLIILGEGIIGLCAAIRKVGSDHAFTADIVGMITCGVAIIYFLWMLYFDQVDTERVGTIRQQIWTILHFPFHVAILLTVEGVSQLSVWRKLLDVMIPFGNDLGAQFPINGVQEAVTETLNSLYEKFENPDIVPTDASQYLNILSNATATTADRTYAFNNIFANGVNFACKNFGIDPPEKAKATAEDDQAILAGIFNTFDTVFLYFFMAAGTTLLILAALFWLGHRNKVRGDYASIVMRILIGLGLALLTIMDLPISDAVQANATNYILSPWMLPTVALCYGLVICLDKILINYVRKVVIRQNESSRSPFPYANAMRYPIVHHV